MAEIDEDTGILTVSARSATATLADGATAYTTGEMVEVKIVATDDDRGSVTRERYVYAVRTIKAPDS